MQQAFGKDKYFLNDFLLQVARTILTSVLKLLDALIQIKGNLSNLFSGF